MTHRKDWALHILKVKLVRDGINLTGWKRSSNRVGGGGGPGRPGNRAQQKWSGLEGRPEAERRTQVPNPRPWQELHT